MLINKVTPAPSMINLSKHQKGKSLDHELMFFIRIDKLVLRGFATEAGTKAVQIAWDYDDGPLQKIRLEIITDEGIFHNMLLFHKFFCLKISIFWF